MNRRYDGTQNIEGMRIEIKRTKNLFHNKKIRKIEAKINETFFDIFNDSILQYNSECYDEENEVDNDELQTQHMNNIVYKINLFNELFIRH